MVFEKLVAVLVFGCAYWRIADEGCSATTLRRRRDEWIEMGLMDALEGIALAAYDRIIGLELADVCVDGCITKAPCGGQKAGPVLCVNTEHCANARRELRGDLKDSAVVA